MTLIERLKNYYGDTSDEVSIFLEKEQEKYSDIQQNDLYDFIIRKRPQKKGFPDIAALSILFENFKMNSKLYYWSVCNECGALYSYQMPICPACYDRGKRVNNYSVAYGTQLPDRKLMCWNKPWLNIKAQDEKIICAECENRNEGYCTHFGDSLYQCEENSFRNCTCKQCCVFYKTRNRQYYTNGGK